ncbi:DUF4148 domain-containing protein [Paraburkholderia aromaticivorans]|uniref:DUF4148 domain-containing protein n=1 Tax=Paraburkholderia aromaticivorans TaxID=2026199 RepID=UPI003D66DB02
MQRGKRSARAHHLQPALSEASADQLGDARARTMTKLSCGDHQGLIPCHAQCPCLMEIAQSSQSICRGLDEKLRNRTRRPAATDGKSRKQVRQELLEAQRQGLIPNTEADYPPS